MLKIPADWIDRMTLGCFNTATTVFNLLPAAEAYRLGHHLVRLWLTLDRDHRRIIEKNLELALHLKAGSPASRQLQAAIIQHLGFNLSEFFLLQNPAWRRLLKKNLQITGLEHLLKAQQEGSGAIIISAHLGNWELAGFLSTLMQRPITTVAKPIKNKPRLYAAIEKSRIDVGFIPVNKSGSAGTLVRNLKKGDIIALLVDQRVRRRLRIWAPFFSYQVPTIPSPAVLARLSGSPIIPAFTTRIRPLHHQIVIEEPIFVPHSGNSREVVADCTKRLNLLIEKHIRKTPEQWFWPHNRWRTINSD
ncbi:MAG: lysophospholipid acyltransferase family protein [Deltaproteobacteria bacterium]|nr:lysophospholipid acyltransferase family protein [Deltaproteobacteria bacterium]